MVPYVQTQNKAKKLVQFTRKIPTFLIQQSWLVLQTVNLSRYCSFWCCHGEANATKRGEISPRYHSPETHL